jgi:hypothetical protein
MRRVWLWAVGVCFYRGSDDDDDDDDVDDDDQSLQLFMCWQDSWLKGQLQNQP